MLGWVKSAWLHLRESSVVSEVRGDIRIKIYDRPGIPDAPFQTCGSNVSYYYYYFHLGNDSFLSLFGSRKHLHCPARHITTVLVDMEFIYRSICSCLSWLYCTCLGITAPTAVTSTRNHVNNVSSDHRRIQTTDLSFACPTLLCKGALFVNYI